MRPPARRTAWVLLAVILVVQGVLLVWHRGHDSAQPHELPVVVQGPSVVASGVADRLNRLPQRPVTAVVVDEDADARDDVRDGRAVAAVVIDLRKADDVLYVSTVNDAETTRLASTLAKRVATPMGRTSVTREVAPAEHPDVSQVHGRPGQRALGGGRVPGRCRVGAAAVAAAYVVCSRRPVGRPRRRDVRGREPARRARLPGRGVPVLVGARLRQHLGSGAVHDRARGGARPGRARAGEHVLPVPGRPTAVRQGPEAAAGLLVGGGSLDSARCHA